MTSAAGLLVAVVDAGRGRIEEALGAGFLGGDQHVGADQHRQHALGLVGLDEAHAAHVGGQVVDHPGALGGGPAGLEQGEVAHLVLDARRLLVPLAERLHVDAADLGVAALLQDANQVTADEATGAGDDHEIILGHLARAFRTKRGLLSDFSKTCEVGQSAPLGMSRHCDRTRGLLVCSPDASPSSSPCDVGPLQMAVRKPMVPPKKISIPAPQALFYRQGVVLAEITPSSS